MAAGTFEVDHWDGAARRGALTVPDRGAVDTPALLPVVNPNRPTVPGADLADLGAQICITNAYVCFDDPDLREAAREAGIHDLIGFEGPVMTDSGAFQLAEYGSIDASNEEILAFQREIGVDIATPVDRPTPPDADRETAASDLETTTDRVASAIAGCDGRGERDGSQDGGPLVAAPVQGGVYPDLRERAADAVADRDADVYPVGGVVPLLREYRFADVVRVTRAAKRGLPLDAPVHCFGAGHPMCFALLAACGCDLFDSAAYALYAREDRYLTPRGTRDLNALDTLPCPCPICTGWTADDLQSAPASERERLLARHNLHVSFAELRRVRAAIRAGDLFELLDARARSHPALLDGYRALLDDDLRPTDPTSKGTFFAVSAESAARPAVARHHDRLDRIAVPDELVLVDRNVAGVPPSVGDALPPGLTDAPRWPVHPPFGPVPPGLDHTYPLTAETPARPDHAACVAAAAGVARVAAAGARIALVHAAWPAAARDRLPDDITCHSAPAADGGNGGAATPGTRDERGQSPAPTDRQTEDR